MKESRIFATKIPIYAYDFSLRKIKTIFIKKNVALITRSISFFSTPSLGFRIGVQSRKTATLAVSGNQAFVAEWEQTG